MTNPNNAIGTNGAYSGRTSVNAFNDDLAAYSRGILTGWNCQVDTGLTVILGGGHSVRDVAIAEDNAGNKTTINNISLDEVPVTLDTAPGANSRIDAIVAYVDNPPQGSSSTADNPEACGIIPVAGTPAVSPQTPDDNAIRTAITADGASGTTAYYVVLATVTVPTGTTDLIPGYIEQGDKSVLNTNQIADGSINSSKLDWTNFTMPTSSVTQLAFGYGYTVTLYRVGNIIMLRSWNAFTANIVNEQSLSEKVPLGYRPVNATTPSKFFADGNSRWVTWKINNDGSMVIYGDARAGDTVLSYAVWPTNDPFPA